MLVKGLEKGAARRLTFIAGKEGLIRDQKFRGSSNYSAGDVMFSFMNDDLQAPWNELKRVPFRYVK